MKQIASKEKLKRYVSPKDRLIFIHGAVSQRTELFITTAGITSNATINIKASMFAVNIKYEQ
jgi:hypothetical protein